MIMAYSLWKPQKTADLTVVQKTITDTLQK